MSTPLTAKERLAAALGELRCAAGRPTYRSLVARAAKEHHVKLSDASLSEWFRGKAVPVGDEQFGTLIKVLTNAPPGPQLKNLHREAWQEGIEARGRRRRGGPSQPTAPRGGRPWIPGIVEVHYANLERIAEFVLARSASGQLPPTKSSAFPTIDRVERRDAFLRALTSLDLPAKRFTQDFDLRTLEAGDLFVFDTWFRTRNGVAPGESRVLTGDLNKDPHIYVQRRGVRVVMPLNPEWITTSTAHCEFSCGGVQLAGLSVIKGRVHPDDVSLVPPTKRALYRASPLVLGIPDAVGRDLELARYPSADEIDPPPDRIVTWSWNWVDQEDLVDELPD